MVLSKRQPVFVIKVDNILSYRRTCDVMVSSGQGKHERRKYRRNVSPLDSVLWFADLARQSQVGQSQHWIKWADFRLLFLLSRYPCELMHCIDQLAMSKKCSDDACQSVWIKCCVFVCVDMAWSYNSCFINISNDTFLPCVPWCISSMCILKAYILLCILYQVVSYLNMYWLCLMYPHTWLVISTLQ